MKYLTGYIRCDLKNGENDRESFLPPKEEMMEHSVLLIQFSVGKHHVVLACVCSGGYLGGCVTESWKQWMAEYKEQISRGRFRRRTAVNMLRKRTNVLLKEQKKTGEDFPETEVNLSGILLVDQECILLEYGKSCVYAVNRKLQKMHCKRIDRYHREGKSKEITVTEGRLQNCVGILIGNETFAECAGKNVMEQCLAAQDIRNDRQIERRLHEMFLAVKEHRDSADEEKCCKYGSEDDSGIREGKRYADREKEQPEDSECCAVYIRSM